MRDSRCGRRETRRDRVQLDLLPELHHGEPQQRWIGDDGVIRLETSRPKRVFDELRMKISLAPGQMLVVAAAPAGPAAWATTSSARPRPTANPKNAGAPAGRRPVPTTLRRTGSHQTIRSWRPIGAITRPK